MASKNPQTMAKRARELAVKERRDRKRAKKAEAAAERAATQNGHSGDGSGDEGEAAVAPEAGLGPTT